MYTAAGEHVLPSLPHLYRGRMLISGKPHSACITANELGSFLVDKCSLNTNDCILHVFINIIRHRNIFGNGILCVRFMASSQNNINA